MVRRSVALIAVAAAAAACTPACTKASPEKPPPVTRDLDDAAPAPPDHRPRVLLTGAKGEIGVRVEVVATEPMIMKGLMYRQFLAPDDGMLFLMGAEDTWGFWMRNTLIPLDIIFITRDLKVAGILHDMKPLDEKSKHIETPSLYVLEVNGGWTKAHGVDTGATVRFEGVKQTDI